MYTFFYNFFKTTFAKDLYSNSNSFGNSPLPLEEERDTQDGQIRITEDGQIRLTE